MKFYILLFLTFFSVNLFAKSNAKIVDLTGEVEVKLQDLDIWLNANRNMELSQKDRVRTINGNCVIKFSNGGVVKLNRFSLIKIPESKDVNINLYFGNLNINTKSLREESDHFFIKSRDKFYQILKKSSAKFEFNDSKSDLKVYDGVLIKKNYFTRNRDIGKKITKNSNKIAEKFIFKPVKKKRDKIKQNLISIQEEKISKKRIQKEIITDPFVGIKTIFPRKNEIIDSNNSLIETDQSGIFINFTAILHIENHDRYSLLINETDRIFLLNSENFIQKRVRINYGKNRIKVYKNSEIIDEISFFFKYVDDSIDIIPIPKINSNSKVNYVYLEGILRGSFIKDSKIIVNEREIFQISNRVENNFFHFRTRVKLDNFFENRVKIQFSNHENRIIEKSTSIFVDIIPELPNR